VGGALAVQVGRRGAGGGVPRVAVRGAVAASRTRWV